MTSPCAWLRKGLFGISLQEVSFRRRGFREGFPGAREVLEGVGRAFLAGYHQALGNPRGPRLAD